MAEPDIHNSFVIHWYRPSAWLQVAGPDAAAFLQGQFTNDLRALVPGAAAYGLWLDQKGKTVADSFIAPAGGGGAYWVGSYFSAAAIIRPRLEDYIIADDVTVEDFTAAWTGVTLFGAEAEAWWRVQAGLPGVFFPGRRGRMPAWEWIFPQTAEPAVLDLLAGRTQADALTLQRWRIAAGIPAVPQDVGPADLPNEAGLEDTAISYTKGCYLGQEIMARLKSRGNVRRRLLTVAGPGPAPALPAKLWQDGRVAGELRSAFASATGAGFRGLAMMTLGGLRRDQPFAVAADGPAQIEILPGPL